MAPPRTDREPLGCCHDYFEVLRVRPLFANMISWEQITRRFSDNQTPPAMGVTYTLTVLTSSFGFAEELLTIRVRSLTGLARALFS